MAPALLVAGEWRGFCCRRAVEVTLWGFSSRQ